jgi:hypothetical protein
MQKKIIGFVLAVYLLSTVAARANPARLQPHQVALSMQGATLAALALILPGLSPAQRRPATALLAVLGLSLAVRVTAAAVHTDPLAPTTVRWDAFATYTGMLGAVGFAAYELGGLGLVVGLIALVLPVLLALPSMRPPSPEQVDIMRRALTWSERAYNVSGLGDYVNDTATGTLAGVAVDGADTVVYFAGTTSATDWVRINADFRLDPLPETWTADCLTAARPSVHRGFLRAYLAVRAKLWGKILENVLRVGGSGRIIVCGHSLGGALATVAALDLACRLDPADAAKLACITFGAPHVGDGQFVQAFNARVPLSLRVATVYDPVPKILGAQLPHVRGLVPLASPLPPNQSHDPKAYRLGIGQPPWQSVLVMVAPAVFVAVIALWFARFGHRIV